MELCTSLVQQMKSLILIVQLKGIAITMKEMQLNLVLKLRFTLRISHELWCMHFIAFCIDDLCTDIQGIAIPSKTQETNVKTMFGTFFHHHK